MAGRATSLRVDPIGALGRRTFMHRNSGRPQVADRLGRCALVAAGAFYSIGIALPDAPGDAAEQRDSGDILSGVGLGSADELEAEIPSRDRDTISSLEAAERAGCAQHNGAQAVVLTTGLVAVLEPEAAEPAENEAGEVAAQSVGVSPVDLE